MNQGQSNIFQLLSDQSKMRPDAPAIIETRGGKTRSTTFKQLEAAAKAVSENFKHHGLKEGEKVLVVCPMSAELYIVLLAIFDAGLTAMLIDPGAGLAHLRHCCATYPPEAIIASPKASLLYFLAPEMRKIPLKFSLGMHHFPGTIAIDRKCKRSGFEKRDFATSPESKPCGNALLTFTSGSSGTPKAIERSHSFLLSQHAALKETLALAPGQIHLTNLPVFVLANLASGVTSLIPDADLQKPGSINPAPVLKQIDSFAASQCVASPAFLERLAEGAERQARQLSSLRQIFAGGGPVFPELITRLQAMAPQAEIITVYGSSEAEPIASTTTPNTKKVSAAAANFGLLVGYPEPSIELRIIRSDPRVPVGILLQSQFADICLPPLEIGEIVVNGAHVVSGYAGGQGESLAKFSVLKQGSHKSKRWHRTGDAGYMDENGRLWLLGRCSAILRDQCGCLYPLPVESAAQELPGIKRAAVVKHQGERVLALEPTVPPAKMDFSALARLKAQFHICRVLLIKQIPKDKRHNSKIDYARLKELLEQKTTREPWGSLVVFSQLKRQLSSAFCQPFWQSFWPASWLQLFWEQPSWRPAWLSWREQRTLTVPQSQTSEEQASLLFRRQCS